MNSASQAPALQSVAWHRLLLASGPILIPLAYLGIIFWLQPTDRLGPPERAPQLERLFYDDYDLTAMALRGLNAHAGRLPGIADPVTGAVPNSRYFLEYPHLALFLFRSAYWLPPSLPADQIPNALLEAQYHALVEHQPRDESERILWHRLRQTIQFYQGVMLACLIGLVLVLQIGYEPERRLSSYGSLLILPAALYFSLNRFDIIPALFVALSLLAAGRRWLLTSALLLGMATMLKVYPVLFAPLLWRYLAGDWRSASLWATVYGLTLATLFGVPWLTMDLEATIAPFQFQLTREPDKLWTAYGSILPSIWREREYSIFRLGSLAVCLGLLCLSRPPSLESVLRRCSLILILFVTLPVFWSPQWILWFVPLLAPLFCRQRSLGVLFVALDFVTYLSFPVVFDGDPDTLGLARNVLVYLRFALLGGLALVLAWAEIRRRGSKRGRESPPERPEGCCA